jgi:hypothetical protein
VRYFARLAPLLLVAGVLAACEAGDAGDTGDADVRAEPAERAGPAALATLAELPVARTELAGAALGDGTIVVVGGFLGDGSVSARVDVYDRAADRWSEGPPLPEPRHHPAMASARGRVWVAGGFGNAGGTWTEASTVWSLGPGDDAWRVEPSLREARGALGLAAVADGTLVAFGGTSGGQVLTSSETLAPRARSWVAGPVMREQREHVAAMSVGGRVYAVAGRVGSFASNKATVESFAVGDAAWRDEPPLTKARGGTAAAAGCVAGGEEDAGTIAPVECLRGGRWIVVAQLARPRHGLAVVALGADLHVVGGGEQPGLHVSAAHEVLRRVL